MTSLVETVRPALSTWILTPSSSPSLAFVPHPIHHRDLGLTDAIAPSPSEGSDETDDMGEQERQKEVRLEEAVQAALVGRASRAALEDCTSGVLADYTSYVRALDAVSERVVDGGEPPLPAEAHSSPWSHAALGELLGSDSVRTASPTMTQTRAQTVFRALRISP